MTAVVVQEAQKGKLMINFIGVAAVTDGGQGAVINPEGVRLLITRCYIDFGYPASVKGETTYPAGHGSTGATNLDMGIAADAVTKGTDLLSSFDGIHATVGAKAWFAQAVNTNEAECAVVWEIGEYLTLSGSGSCVGMYANVYVEYIRLD